MLVLMNMNYIGSIKLASCSLAAPGTKFRVSSIHWVLSLQRWVLAQFSEVKVYEHCTFSIKHDYHHIHHFIHSPPM